MKKYLVRISCNKYVTYEVEANNEMEALDVAESMNENQCVDHEEYNHEYAVTLIEDGVDEEQMRNDFADKLHSLMHRRMTFEELARTMREWSCIDNLELYDIDAEGDTDYQICFDITINKHPLYGEYDIYYLKTREMEDGQEVFYITEVGYSFYND